MSAPLANKMNSKNKSPFLSAKVIGLFLGPTVAITLLLLGAPAEMQAVDGDFKGAWVTFALLILMAIWWITEAIPIPVTALLPLIVLPMFGVASIKEASAPYMHPIVVMLMGGFIFAKAIEQWRLHERIALFVVCKTASSPAKLIGGFMIASALLSMWISNTATSIMMVPIALSVAAALGDSLKDKQQAFTMALLLGITYACSIGGLGTPIGTPTNLIVIGYLNDHHDTQIDFSQWMMFGIPLIILLLPLTWLALTKFIFRIPNIAVNTAQNQVEAQYKALGAMTTPQARTLIVFCIIAFLWAFRGPLSEINIAGYTPLSGLTDHVTAIIAVLLCFVIPSGEKNRPGQRLLDWKVAEQIPWGVVLLFGGGMSLAQSISQTGLSTYLGQNLSVLAELPVLALILIVTTFVILLTEITSNIATASAVMPVIGAMAVSAGIPIELMAVPVALAAGCAFMLPMATGPNAVVFATDKVSIMQMASVGVRINIIAIITITILAYFIAPIVFG
jgi:sodium-dependent dicarboxylate transporter 2/3/5|tara:strand:+ start:1163 stop:2680 length:1518 start_codon:yes stop_codon:yes gene_type:complete